MASTQEADRLAAWILSAFKEVFIALDGGRVEDRNGCRQFVCRSVPLPAFNSLWAIQHPAEAAVSGLAPAMAEVERMGLPFGVLLRSSRAPELEAEAQRLGLTAAERIPAMVMAADELRDPGARDIEITRVTGKADLDRTLSVMEAGFEVPPGLLQALCCPAVAQVPGVSIYLATVDGEPVSTATSWLGDGGIGIFNVATPPAMRGRGYGTAVTARAAAEGFMAGAELAWLQSSHLGESVYRRMGFRQVDSHLLLSRPTAVA
jgi:ribosomal protein S18 acetylase RimI-like enzyme